MLLLILIALPILNMLFYEYRVLKGPSKNPIDITPAYVTLQFMRRYK